MSDTTDGFDFYAEQLLQKSKTNPLRERMQAVLSEHGGDIDLKQVRASASSGDDLSDVVTESREERL
jgi:Fe-S cluster biogenesis protein NfuA